MTQAPATPLPPLDVDALIARIQAEAAADTNQPTVTASATGVAPAPMLTPSAQARSGSRPFTWPNAASSLGVLLSPLDHDSFLSEAYSRLLGRAPDPVGLERYGQYLNRGGSRLLVLYALRYSAEGKTRAQALKQGGEHPASSPNPLSQPLPVTRAMRYLKRGGTLSGLFRKLKPRPSGAVAIVQINPAPWRWLYRLMPWRRPLGPLLRSAEQQYLMRHPQYLAQQAVRVMSQRLDGEITQRLDATEQQHAQRFDAVEQQHAQRLDATEQQQAQRFAEFAERLDATDQQQAQQRQQTAELRAEQANLRGDTRNLADRAVAVETDLAKQRGGSEWLQRQIDELQSTLARLEDSSAQAQTAIATEIARRERLSKDLDFIRSDLIYHRGQARDLIEALRANTANASLSADARPTNTDTVAADPQSPSASNSNAPVSAPSPQIKPPTDPLLDADDRLDAYYVAFEEEFRGAPEQIRETQEGYIADLLAADSVTPSRPLLDLGCGRGEWLALLAEHGLSAKGVDTNAVMVARCREQGLDARVADALAALQALPDAGLGAVSAFHLIEHLPFSLLHALLEHAHRVLSPGGLLLLETPNPENVLVGSHTFYHDPTHLNPMTPTATRFLLRYLGFADPEIRRLHPYPDDARVPGNDPLTERVNGHLCGPQDFALIARKPAPSSAIRPTEQAQPPRS